MKKKLCSIVCLCYFVSIMLCACGRKEQGNPIRLPAREDIVSIGVSDGDKYAISPNTEGEATEFIDEFLSMLMDMETTSQQSINDAPVNKDSITININCDGAAGTTLFYYVDKGIEYVEQPYQGIYKPTPALGNCITEMLASADNRPLMVTFQASVIETNHDSIIVKPVDGSLELDSADKFYISNEENLELQIGDFVEISYNGEIMESYPAQLGEVYKITVIEQTEANAMWDRIPMVRIDGKLYYDTGRESIMDARCGTMDGEITSTVDGTEIPTEDNQSNFGSGFGYQYGADDTIEIYMNEKWFVVADGLFCREIDGLFCRSSPDIIVRRRCVLSHKRRGWLQPSPSFRYSRNLALQDELYHPVINNGPAVLVCVDKRLGTGPVNQSRDAG